MKKSSLRILVICSLVLTAVLLLRPTPTSPPRPAKAASVGDALFGRDAASFRHSRPTHWRDSILQQ